MKKTKFTPFHWLAIVLIAQFLATGYCIHRVDQATKIAASEIYDSIYRHIDDTTQINQIRIPEDTLTWDTCHIGTVADPAGTNKRKK